MSASYMQERKKLGAFQTPPQDNNRFGKEEELRTTPLFSLQVRHHVADDKEQEHVQLKTANQKGAAKPNTNQKAARQDPFKQYGLLGFHAGNNPNIPASEPILQNTRTPSSTFICGSQGSGKSYTLGTMLENCLLPSEKTGSPGPAMAGLLFHYDVDACDGSVAEAASLCSLGVKVRVLVSPTDRRTLEPKYMALKGAKGNLTVEDLYFEDRHLTVDRMLKLMAFAEGGFVPLYVTVIQRILREMATAGANFISLAKLKAEINKQKNFTDQQKAPMDLRFDLLEGFMMSNNNPLLRPQIWTDPFKPQPGTLTIIDMSSTFVNSATASLLFDTCLSIFKQNRPKGGMVVALDEAHKFMDESVGAEGLTDRLLTTIREQRHNATRVIIATQEPTISPKLLDLCSVSIVHRFTSPAWFTVIKAHLGAAAVGARPKQPKKEFTFGDEDAGEKDMFQQIMALEVGESLVFAPSAFVCMNGGEVKKLSAELFRMKTRVRLGADGGSSVLADAGEPSREASSVAGVKSGEIGVKNNEAGVKSSAARKGVTSSEPAGARTSSEESESSRESGEISSSSEQSTSEESSERSVSSEEVVVVTELPIREAKKPKWQPRGGWRGRGRGRGRGAGQA